MGFGARPNIFFGHVKGPDQRDYVESSPPQSIFSLVERTRMDFYVVPEAVAHRPDVGSFGGKFDADDLRALVGPFAREGTDAGADFQNRFRLSNRQPLDATSSFVTKIGSEFTEAILKNDFRKIIFGLCSHDLQERFFGRREAEEAWIVYSLKGGV